jgi:uncharacterized protein
VELLPLLALWVMTAVGAVAQGSLGFGLGFTVVPMLALLAPAALPTVPLLLAVPLMTGVALRDRRAVDLPGSAWVVLGRLPGTAIGAWLLTVLGADPLAVVAGIALLAAVGLSTWRPTGSGSTGERVAAGFTSGVLGTSTGIGGPVISLSYRGRPAAEMRATVGLALLTGVVMSLAAVAVAGRLHVDQLIVTAQLLPAVAAGLWASRRLNRFLDDRWLRPAVLVTAGAGGLLTIVLALT